jgi:hypothetical protein
VLKQRDEDIRLYTQLMDEVREKVANGTSPNCFAKHLLEEQANLGMTDLEIAYTAGSPFGAGVETVSIARPLLKKSLTKCTVCWVSRELLLSLRKVRTSIHPPCTRRARPCRWQGSPPRIR